MHANLYAMPQIDLENHGSVYSYTFLNANFQLAILHNVDAVIQLPRTKDVFTFMQLHKKHVLAQFQEKRFLKVAKDPAGKKMRY